LNGDNYIEYLLSNGVKEIDLINLNIHRGLCAVLLIFILMGCSKPQEDMALIPEGEFIMGSNQEKDEGPERMVFLRSFYIDKFEVTNANYSKFVKETRHREPKEWLVYGYREDKKDHPVIFVSLSDAVEYCKWMGKRLPTEDEWEKAARGSDGHIYPWGNKFESERANTSLSGIVGTTKVGLYKWGSSPYGVYDMAGNVWEWTNSDYNEKAKVVRGGSWGLSHRFARTFTRIGYKPDMRINNLGFRCAKDK
jgi:iron(II)-dependent oxidoreductase